MNHWTDSRSSEDEIDYNNIALMETSSEKNEPHKRPKSWNCEEAHLSSGQWMLRTYDWKKIPSHRI